MSNPSNFRTFFLSNWAVSNRVTVYLLTFVIVLLGVVSYNDLPKENFPEIAVPTIFVGTIYPGTGPADIENLVTRKIENEVSSVKGVKKIKSNSKQDFSIVTIEFETNKDVTVAKREVQEAVDRAKSELPKDLLEDPSVQEINFSEFPIMFLNVYGDDPLEIKKYAEELQDAVEAFPEITRVDIVGALDREIQINVDLFRAQSAGITFGDIEGTIARENIVISGGTINTGTLERNVRVNGEFESVGEIGNLIIQGQKGNNVFLRDIATVQDTTKIRESYARLNGKDVVTLNVIKKGGENLVNAAGKIKAMVADFEKNVLPGSVKVNLSGDQSYLTNSMLSDLTNTIILGFILVTLVLMFFMGLRDSLFVGLSIPLSSLVTFVFLPWIGFTLNLVVLFAFIFAMGIVVDNAIVVIENTYRILKEEKLSMVDTARKASGQVIGPVIAGTMTTIAPFLPLAFWEGMIGEFMFFLPITIIVTLTASILVAYILNPVFAVTFMKRITPDVSLKRFLFNFGIVTLLFLISIGINPTLRNSLMFYMAFMLIYRFGLKPGTRWFQGRVIPAMMNGYQRLLTWSLTGNHPYRVIGGVVLLFIFSFVMISQGKNEVSQFPSPEPNFVYVYNTFDNGTDVETTNRLTKEIEDKVYDVIGRENDIVKSVITNVAIGAGNPQEMDRSASPNKSRIQVEFVEFKKREGVSTLDYLADIREKVKGFSGVQTIVEQEQGGPPVGKAVNIEVTADDFDRLMVVSNELKQYLDSIAVPGVEKLKWDLELGKPEIVIDVDRQKAARLGISSIQIGGQIRTALFGLEISKFRENEDEFPIVVRLGEKYREDLEALMGQTIVYRNMADQGKIYEVKLSSVVKFHETESFGGINRLDQKKVVTIASNILTGYDKMAVVGEVTEWMNKFAKTKETSGIRIEMTGEMKEQAETSGFMGRALGTSVLLIILILVAQFNSMANLWIIMTQILFSMIGVFLGFALTGMGISIVMVGIGVVSLSGIVVNNGILLLDFVEQMRKSGMKTRDAIVESGRVRLTPVLLTKMTTILGLLPMAVAFNINFETLFTELNPEIWFGGDNSVFWGPLAWTIIFGLVFATLITLVIVPVMYYLSHTASIRFWRFRNRIRHSKMLG